MNGDTTALSGAGNQPPAPKQLSREARRAKVRAYLRAENKQRQRMIATAVRFSATHGISTRHR